MGTSDYREHLTRGSACRLGGTGGACWPDCSRLENPPGFIYNYSFSAERCRTNVDVVRLHGFERNDTKTLMNASKEWSLVTQLP